MKVIVFTRNQRRHAHLVNMLVQAGNDVTVVLETNTLFPGQVKDFYGNSEQFRWYFDNVLGAERSIFGEELPLFKNASFIPMKGGDLGHCSLHDLDAIFSGELFIVFGSSYIKGELAKLLVDRGAINIHMGLSPWYRGSSCNFWACADRRLGFVGATVHLLSEGLDSGPILYHCIPKYLPTCDIFKFTMSSVKVAHDSVVRRISDKTIFNLKPVTQDATQQLRYSRAHEFTDSVISSFRQSLTAGVFNEAEIEYPDLIVPYFGN
ncbi:formyltransferase family protein [Litorivicinus sp.]|nr:formyltransferase family protein [Litorivicinus sp.]